MAEKWALQFPSSVKQSDGEKGDVAKIGGAPPVHLVPKLRKREEGESPPSVSIKLSEVLKDTYPKFDGGEPEDALRHILTFKSVAGKLDLAGQYKHYLALKKEYKSQLDDLGPEQDGDSDDVKKKRATAKEARDECIAAIRETRQEYFGLFERLLDTNLVSEWQNVVSKECDEVPYIAKDGVKVEDKPRGRNIASMDACIRTWLLKVVKPNSAERHRKYLNGQIKKPDAITCDQYIDRVVELNKYLLLLPCLKDQEGAPKKMPRANLQFNEMELCDIILNGLRYPLLTAYWAAKGCNYVPMKVEDLRQDLRVIEPNWNNTNRLVQQVKKQGKQLKSLGVGTSAGNKRNAEGSIPCKNKSKSGNSKDKGQQETSGDDKRQKKMCQRCKIKSPKVMYTHNTSDCTKWDENLNDKRPPHKQSAKQMRALKKEMMGEMKQSFATLSKEMFKRTKKAKRKSKKHSKKKSTYYDDSSSSSSSGSDSE